MSENAADAGATGAHSARWRRGLGYAGASLVAFLLGLGAGGGEPTDSAGYRDLQAETEMVRDQLTDAEAEVARLEAAAHDVVASQEEVALRTAELEARQAELDAQAAAIKVSEEALAQREIAVADAEATVADDTGSVPAPQPFVGDSSGTYYENCDAARAAGAAPVLSGDPGYAAHLDRDDDGVGCE